MASASKTPNLNLPQWVGTEKPERTDFNAAFDAIDDATKKASCSVIHNANQLIPNGVDTYLNFNTEIFDTDNMHDNATNNSRLTCNSSGIYLIGFCIGFGGPPSTNLRAVSIMKNRSTIIYLDIRTTIVGNLTYITGSFLTELMETDYVEVRAFQNSGSGPFVQYVASYSPVFSMVKVG